MVNKVSVSCKLSSGAGPDDEDDLSSLPSGSIVEGGDRACLFPDDSSISSVGSASSTTSKVNYF